MESECAVWESPFLSTPSARRATDNYAKIVRGIKISIHALREEGDYNILTPICKNIISIHALREEGDAFQRPVRKGDHMISIHALREEGDVAISCNASSG